MRRTVVVASLFAVLGLLAGVWSAAPPRRRTPARDAPRHPRPATAKVKNALPLARKLERVVNFPGIDDPKTTLLEALNKLTRDYGLVFDLNERAFKYEMLNEPLRVPIAEMPIAPMTAPLATILQKILDRVPVPTGAVYLVRGKVIEITTGDYLREEVYVWGYPGAFIPGVLFSARAGDRSASYRGPAFPLVNLAFCKRPLEQALRDLASRADFNIVLDSSVGELCRSPITIDVRNVPLDTAVLLLANMAGLQPLRLDNTFYVTTQAKAEALGRIHRKMRPTPTKAEVVQTATEKAWDEVYKDFYRQLAKYSLAFERPSRFGGIGIPLPSKIVPMAPTGPVSGSFVKRPLAEALTQLARDADTTVVLDARAAREGTTPITVTLSNTSLETAVRLLADMAGLKVVVLPGALYVTTPTNARELEKEQERRRLTSKAAQPGGEVSRSPRASQPRGR
jgi:hypothetical protein